MTSSEASITGSFAGGPMAGAEGAALRTDPRFAGLRGQGVTVVVIDTGVDLSAPIFGADKDGDGIADRILFQHDFVGAGDADATDEHGHGTAIAAAIAAGDGTHPGLAPEAGLVVLRALDASGRGTALDIAEAMDWALANAQRYNIVAVNLSFAAIGTLDAPVAGMLTDRLRALAASGVVAVAAAGNVLAGGASAGLAAPATDALALTVGAVGAAGTAAENSVAAFSRNGEGIDVFAHGTSVTVAAPGGGGTTLSGTSLAAAEVTGMVALAQQLALQDLGRRLEVDELRGLLQASGTPVDGAAAEGARRADLTALAQAILALPPATVAAPVPALAPAPAPAFVSAGGEESGAAVFMAAAGTTPSLGGIAWHWKTHALLSGTTATLTTGGGTSTATTDATGRFALDVPAAGAATLALTRSASDTAGTAAITSADALAALKIAVGRNPNADPDGSGPLQPLLISPYQFIAADVTGDGKVDSRDALAILKMAVRRPDAPAREWIFVREDADFWNETTSSVTLTRSSIAYSKPPFAVDPASGTDVNVVGVLKGDVDGSWKPPTTGAQILENAYFGSLASKLGVPAAFWGFDSSADLGASGRVIDGYVAGATVFRDANRNGVLDAGESSTMTNATGQFSGLGGSASDPIVAFGGTDVNTLAPLIGTLVAPGTAKVVTPLTTLVAALLPTAAAPTQAQITTAVGQVQAALGLGTADILTADLGASNLAPDLLPALKASVQVANLIAAVGGGANGAAVVARFAQMIGAGQPVVLTNAASVQTLIGTSSAANGVNAAPIATIVATQNQAIGNAADATGVITAQASQTDIYAIAQFKALASPPSFNTYVIADASLTLQAATGTADRAILTGARNILASDTAIGLSVADAGAFAAKLLSRFDIRDGGDAISNAPSDLLDAAKTIVVTSGVANLTVAQAGDVATFAGAAYRVFDTKAALEAALSGGAIAGAAEIEASDFLSLDVPVAIAARVAGEYRVVDNAASIQAQADAGDPGEALGSVDASEIRILGDGTASLPAALANKVTQGAFAIIDQASALSLVASPNALANAVSVTARGGGDADRIDLSAFTRGVVIDGQGGDDSLVGGTGSDTLFGGAGSDRLDGGGGADTLTGGGGNDILTGESGADRFVFSTTTAQGGSDVVADFQAGGAGDRIALAFGGAGELAQAALHGAGTGYAEVAAGGTIGADAGLVVVTTPAADLTAASALAFATQLLSNPANSFVVGDMLLIAFANGTDTAIFQVADTPGGALSFDSAQLLATLQGLGSAVDLAPQNFIDFA